MGASVVCNKKPEPQKDPESKISRGNNFFLLNNLKTFVDALAEKV